MTLCPQLHLALERIHRKSEILLDHVSSEFRATADLDTLLQEDFTVQQVSFARDLCSLLTTVEVESRYCSWVCSHNFGHRLTCPRSSSDVIPIPTTCSVDWLPKLPHMKRPLRHLSCEFRSRVWTHRSHWLNLSCKLHFDECHTHCAAGLLDTCAVCLAS